MVAPLQGLMQRHALDVGMVLRRAAIVHGQKQVISIEPGGVHHQTWAETADRVGRLGNALGSLGVNPGDRVGSFAWNTHRHLELYYSVPMSGAVLTTLNIRLHPPDVAWVANHAGTEIVFVDAGLTETFAAVRRDLPSLRHVVVMGDPSEAVDPGLGDYLRYEELLAGESSEVDWPDLDENTAAVLCYTSGTTGKPKGVLYSHRSEVLHALGALGADSHAIAERDVVLSLAPLFHANSWGLAYSTALAGSTLVLPGRDLSPSAVVTLIEQLDVTVAAAIPTVWLTVDRWLDEHPERGLGRLERIICGGAAVTEDLLARFEARGVRISQAWGMTEMSPGGTMSMVRSEFEASTDEERRRLLALPGVAVAGVELRVVDDDGNPLPNDGSSTGELEARGPWVAAAYYRPDDQSNQERFHDGWLRTGDIATIDQWGYVRIVDRVKDVVKSGGEWISSLELENHLADHPDVTEAAVIGVSHATWQERPVALMVLRSGADLDEEEMRSFLVGRVASWWIPDRFIAVDQIPHTAVGKTDKRALRSSYATTLDEDRR
jgi:fatty-acyl-CoA synthase